MSESNAAPARRGNFFAVAAAAVAGVVVGVNIPEILKIKQIDMLKHKNTTTGRIENYRMSLCIADEDAKNLVVSIPVRSADEIADEMNTTLPEEKKGTFVLDPLTMDAANKPQYTSRLWYGREYKPKGKPGITILQDMPCKPLLNLFEKVGEMLKDPENLKYAKEHNLLTTTVPQTINGENRELTILSIPLDEIPEDLRQFSCWGTVDEKTKTVTFKAASANSYWCFGTQPNNHALPGVGNRTQTKAGIIPSIGGAGGTVSAKVEKMLQNTLDACLKKYCEETKVEALKVEQVRVSRQANVNSARHNLLAAAIGAQTQVAKAVEVAARAESEPSATTIEEEISFDDVPAS